MVAACIACGVPSLVYTSTYNTVFGGVEIVAGDESLPLFPLDAHCDAYSRTKALAEQAVLAADGARHVGKDGDPGRGRLHTTALRPAAIYGAGERRHLPRTVENARRGWYKCTFGKPSSLTDMVHVSRRQDEENSGAGWELLWGRLKHPQRFRFPKVRPRFPKSQRAKCVSPPLRWIISWRRTSSRRARWPMRTVVRRRGRPTSSQVGSMGDSGCLCGPCMAGRAGQG